MLFRSLSRINYLQKVISRYESVQKISEERQISEADYRQIAKALALTNLRLKLLQYRNPFLGFGPDISNKGVSNDKRFHQRFGIHLLTEWSC